MCDHDHGEDSCEISALDQLAVRTQLTEQMVAIVFNIGNAQKELGPSLSSEQAAALNRAFNNASEALAELTEKLRDAV